MNLILDLFRGYEIEYDRTHKVVIINKPIPIKEFMYLKELLKRTNSEVKDIRVYGDKISKVGTTL